jgi:hypothetical protein
MIPTSNASATVTFSGNQVEGARINSAQFVMELN